jgi:hypothetical protein
MMSWLTEEQTQATVINMILSQPQILAITQDLGYEPAWQIWPAPVNDVVNIRCTFDIEPAELTWLLVRYPDALTEMEF